MADELMLFKGVPVFDGQFVLSISKDKMSALLRPTDMNETAGFDRSRLQAELNAHGVVFGLLDTPMPIENGNAYCVARGVSSIDGENARVKLHVRPAAPQMPKESSSSKERVDYRELQSIVNVSKGQMLAEKIPPTPGIPGTNVLDEPINPKPGKDVILKVSNGVEVSPDGMLLSAAVDGKFVMMEGKPAVLTKHVIPEDVDMSVGHVDFVGESLVVGGSVSPGFKVHCKGDIEVGDGIENARLDAEGKLTIKGRIGEHSEVRSIKNMVIRLAENSILETKGGLTVADYVMQCSCLVGEDMRVTQGKGAVIGGRYVIGGSFHVKELGNSAEVKTYVSVGIKPEIWEEKRKLEEEQKIWPEKLNEVIRNISSLEQLKKKQGGQLPPDKEALRKKLNKIMPEIIRQIEKLKESEKEIKERLEKAIHERIFVYGTLFTGVTVQVGTVARDVTLAEEKVVVQYQGPGEIAIRKMTPDEYKAGTVFKKGGK